MLGLKRRHSLEDRIKSVFIEMDFDSMFSEIHEHIDAIDAGLDQAIEMIYQHDLSEGPSFDCLMCLTKAIEDELSGTYDGALGPIDGVVAKIAEMTNG